MLMGTSPARDKGCDGRLSGMLNLGTQRCLLSGYLDFRQENVPQSSSTLEDIRLQKQGHEWHEEKFSWRPKKVWMAAYEKRIIIKLSSVFPILHFFFLVAEISFPFARDVQGRN